MSGFPFDRSFHPTMSQCLPRLAANFKIENKDVPWDELISSDTVMNELSLALSSSGWPSRTFQEIRKELLRLNGRWNKIQHKSESDLKFAAKHPFLWIDDSEDEDDIFMPITKATTTASSKGKSSASSKSKSSASTKTKSFESSKGKSSAFSKGKSSASTEDDDDDFM